VVAKFRERLPENKQRLQIFHMERFNQKNLNKAENKEKYHIVVSNRFAALEDLGTEVDNNSGRESIRENTKVSAEEGLGYYEVKKQKP
jgi:hypothetical protein